MNAPRWLMIALQALQALLAIMNQRGAFIVSLRLRVRGQ